MRNRKPVIDYARVAEGFLFDTTGLRCRYLGKTSWQKPQWLKENEGKWWRLEDVEQPVEPETTIEVGPAEPNGQKSSPDTRKDADDDERVSLVGTPPEPCSPPCQPESVPAPVNENAQTELPRSEEGATRETNGSDTETISLGETGQDRGRADGRQRKKRKLSAKASKARRRVLAERMRRMRVVLDSLSECPIQSTAARKAGIHRKTLEYWIKHSKAGDDGYDIECEGLMWRFHQLVEFAIDEAHDKIEEVAWERAKGELYKKDGVEVPDLYIRPPDWKMCRFLLERRRPEKWGKHPKIDIPQKGGMVLIGDTPKQQKCPEASIKARKWKSMAAMVRKTED